MKRAAITLGIALAALLSGCEGGPHGPGMKVEPLPAGAASAPSRPAPAFPADLEEADAQETADQGLPAGHPSIAAPGAGAARGEAPDDSVHASVHGGAAPAQDGASGSPAAPPGMSMTTPDAETDGDKDLPLKRTGLNSAEELRRGLSAIPGEEARTLFERGFRLTFTTRKEARGYREARELLERALAIEPRLAEAHRAVGYAGFNSGMSMADVLARYRKAIEIKPDYGEAHYALAFFLGGSDPQEGAVHFRRAMQLGVPDERSLRATYYSQIEMH